MTTPRPPPIPSLGKSSVSIHSPHTLLRCLEGQSGQEFSSVLGSQRQANKHNNMADYLRGPEPQC